MSDESLKILLGHGVKIVGAGVGAVVQGLISPSDSMAGAVIGATLGQGCANVLDDVAQRFMSLKEKERVGGVAAIAISEIKERLLWEEPRSDGFLDESENGPSPAEEVFEGVLLAAKQEHEQQKLPYLANFYSGLVFYPSVSKAQANFLLSLAESLTYRQLVILTLVEQINSFKTRDRPWQVSERMHPNSHSISMEALVLYQQQLVVSYNVNAGRGDNVYEPGLVIPARSMISGPGVTLCHLMGLHKIPKQELEALASEW